MTKQTSPSRKNARSVATALSWKDKRIAEARMTHHAVRVAGRKYASTLQAFKALGLDIKKHIKFRKTLKEQGKAVFDGRRFTLVEHH